MGPGPSLPMAVAADRSDNMVITGYFDAAPFDIGGGALPYAGNRDIYLGVFDGTNGAHLFSTAYGGANDDQPSGVFADRRTGDVLLTGEFQLTMGIGATSLASDGAYDIFLASLGTIP